MSNIIALFPIWGDNFNFRFFAGAYATRRSTRLSFTLTRSAVCPVSA